MSSANTQTLQTWYVISAKKPLITVEEPHMGLESIGPKPIRREQLLKGGGQTRAISESAKPSKKKKIVNG